MTPRNGLTLTRYRVVVLGEFRALRDDKAALVEEIDSGRPVAECWTVDAAERIARALEFATTPVVEAASVTARVRHRATGVEFAVHRMRGTVAEGPTDAGVYSSADLSECDVLAPRADEPLPAPLYDDGYRVYLPVADGADPRSGDVVFEYKYSLTNRVGGATEIVAKMVALYNADAALRVRKA